MRTKKERDFPKTSETLSEGRIWTTLTDQQKKEVFLSYEESNDKKNLISWNEVKNKSFVL